MEDSSKTLFYYIQKLILKLKSDKYKRVWDHTFTLVEVVIVVLKLLFFFTQLFCHFAV